MKKEETTNSSALGSEKTTGLTTLACTPMSSAKGLHLPNIFYQHLLLNVLKHRFLTGVLWNLRIVLVCISVMAKRLDFFSFKYLLVNCAFPLRTVYSVPWLNSVSVCCG